MIKKELINELIKLRLEKSTLDEEIKKIEKQIKDDDEFTRYNDPESGIKISRVERETITLKKDISVAQVMEKYENLCDTQIVIKDIKALFAVDPDMCAKKVSSSIRVEGLPKSL